MFTIRSHSRRALRRIGLVAAIGASAVGVVSATSGSAAADTVDATYLGTDFVPATSMVCGPGETILKFTGGTTFDDGAHSDKSSGDPEYRARWSIVSDETAGTVALTSVTYRGIPLLVSGVVISDNGSGEAYSWDYTPLATASDSSPLVQTVTSAHTQINPLNDNHYLFVCAGDPAASTGLTLVKQVVGGPAQPSDWPLTATGSAWTLSGQSGINAYVPSGVYELSEGTGPADYTLTSIDCLTSTGQQVESLEGGFLLLDGTQVTCTLVNTYVADPTFTVSKSSPVVSDDAAPTGTSAGDRLTYTLTLTNTGVVALANASIDDPMLTTLNCSIDGVAVSQPATLAGGKALVCIGSIVLNQSTVDSGSIYNAATFCTDNAGCQDDDNDHEITRNPALATVKTVTGIVDTDANTFASVGDVVSFGITATNTGNVTLANVTVVDNRAGVELEALADCSWPLTGGTLLPGEAVTCEARYTLTQNDVDGGSFANDATSCADAPNGTTPSRVCDDGDVVVDFPRVPVLTVDKTSVVTLAGVDGILDDIITYSITATNSGNVTISNVTVNDALVGLGALTCDPTQGSALLPGETMMCTADYTITQADVDAGGVTNVAQICGDAPTGSAPAQPCDDDDDVVTIERRASIVTDKSAVVEAAGRDGAIDDVVTYTITATNTGNVTLTNAVITDVLPGLSALTCDQADPMSIAPNATLTCVATYVLTQADVDAGGVVNMATVCTETPTGMNPTGACDDDDHTVDVERHPSLSTDKTVARVGNDDGEIVVGEDVEFSIVVNNDGDVTLSIIQITDALSPLTFIGCDWPSTIGILAPGETTLCAAVYELTQDDVDHGSVTNVATACGQVADGIDADSQPDFIDICDSGTAVLDIPRNPAIDVVKTGTAVDTDGDGTVEVGESIDYTFTVTNIGNVTLANVAPTDALCSSAIVFESGDADADARLDLSETWVFSCTRSITQADVDNDVTNTVNVCADSPDATMPCDDDTVVTTLPKLPGVSIVKGPELQRVAVGSNATFTITVTNTGNLTLSNVTVADPSTPACDRSGVTLAPGETLTYECSVVAFADFTNVATVTATGPGGHNPADDDDDAVVDVVPKISVTKTASAATAQIGSPTTFTFTVSNLTGDPIDSVTLTDDVFGDIGSTDRSGANGTEANGAIMWLINADNCVIPSTLAAAGQTGSSYTCTVIVTFKLAPTATTMPVHTNIATSTGSDDDGNTASGTDGETVKLSWRGRTPGYWKTHTKAGQWVGYTTGTLIQNVFTIPACLKNTKGNLDLGVKSSTGAGDTLLQGLNYQGTSTMSGGAEILFRAGVSALLNERMFGAQYPAASSVADLIAQVNAALATCDRPTMISLATTLDYWNNGVH